MGIDYCWDIIIAVKIPENRLINKVFINKEYSCQHVKEPFKHKYCPDCGIYCRADNTYKEEWHDLIKYFPEGSDQIDVSPYELAEFLIEEGTGINIIYDGENNSGEIYVGKQIYKIKLRESCYKEHTRNEMLEFLNISQHPTIKNLCRETGNEVKFYIIDTSW